jgi:hypothetical protein
MPKKLRSSMATKEQQASTSRGVEESKTSTTTTTASAQDSYDYGDPSAFDVLSLAFAYLSAKDLRNCRSVCKTWLEVADRTAAYRQARFEWESVFARLRPSYIQHLFKSDPEPLDAYVHAFVRNEKDGGLLTCFREHFEASAFFFSFIG